MVWHLQAPLVRMTVRMLCNTTAQQSSAQTCRAGGAEQQERGHVERSGVAGGHGPWPQGQGAGAVRAACPSHPACKLSSASPCCHLLAKMPLIPHRVSRVPSDDHPPNCPSQHMALCYLIAAQTFKLPPSQPCPCAWIRINFMGQFSFSPAITRLGNGVIFDTGLVTAHPAGLLHGGDAGA